MNLRRTSVRALVAGSAACALTLGLAHPALAQENSPAGAQLEALDRGLVAVSTGDGEGVFLSWRLLATEAGPATDTGVSGPSFAVFRDGERIATVDDSTNYADADGSAASVYTVAPAWHDITGEQSAPVSVWGNGYHDLKLQKPADGTTPKGDAYTYSANDASVADVDGDGALEFIVKWDPSNSKDVSQKGYTGNVYIDTYELDGTLLNRIDLGKNIRAGAHYTQFMVSDFDGDGRAETMLKTAPGTQSTRYNADGTAQAAEYITLLAEDVEAGVTNDDDYRLSAAGYRAHLVEMFQGWSEHPEVVAGNWPATLEEAFGIPVAHEYPLSKTSAEELAAYFIDVHAPARSARNDLTTFEGFILDGPEYLTVFDSATGEELETIRYEPGRGDDGLLWGDYAMARIEPGNRVDRFLAGVAYLDGEHPSAVFARGYYTRTTLRAYDWDGEHLTTRWAVDSGHAPMSNPFNGDPHGDDGTDPEFGDITTQGFHSLSAADVDGDGKHEIVYGAATIDDDGSKLYTSFDHLPAESEMPGVYGRLGHGDAMHVTDIDPDRPGLEIFTAHEGGGSAPYGMAMRDAATGEVLFGRYSGKDTGRSMIGDVRPDVRGLEAWASLPGGSDALGIYSASGTQLGSSIPGTNQSIRWAADMTTQIVNGSGDATPTIDDWTRGTLLTATGTRTNNGTKGNPSLVADVLGDWREELLVRTADSSALRIYTSTEVTTHKLPTLLHDVQYRAEVARQNTTYNQPSYTSYYFASDMDFANVPVRTTAATPGAPKFTDPKGSNSDHVVVTPDASFDYYVNGVKAEKPLVKVPAGSEVRVTAVPKAGFAVASGAVSTWTHAFSK